ncbi:sensor histidine kinase [Butyrivibrio sp. NC3005]|uniref:sensor histidine kinase n=1 Tax=Butyrivibrio sp. NC3005 TaxID=1280685 RepID=UPI0003FB6B43|nr:HAMP domain-containing sensor histidine kinase [Butyrivibrio sp. NC3005]
MLHNKENKTVFSISSIVTIVFGIAGFFIGGKTLFLLTTILGIILIFIFFIFTKKRYENIEALNSYLVKVLSGDEVPDILSQEEGELSILKSNIYKTTTTLKYQRELILQDKKRLADAIADISHQLKTPLTSMMVMNDLLEAEDDKDKQRKFLKTQSDQLDRMNWLIQTLLKLSKIDAGTITMKKEETSCKNLLASALKAFEIQMELKNIKCSTDSLEIDISCDKNWTVEALQNIIKNCIEHMEEGGSLSIRAEETNIFKQIIISDSGCGIDKEDIPHIFERFYKGKNAGKDSVGIGLALSKTIILSQHGDILVESKKGEGSSFFIRFYKTII